MQVIGFNFDKIHAEKKKHQKGKIEVSSNIAIKSVEEEKLEAIKDKPVIKFDFEFFVTYKPDFADIRLNGTVMLLMEKDEAREVLKKWKDKKISQEVQLPLFNLILTKSNLKALQLEEELNLPTHVPLPRLKPPQENNNNTNYAG